MARLPLPRSPSPFAVGTAVALLLVFAGPARAQLDQALPMPPEPEREKPAPKLTKPPEIRKPVEPVYPPEAFAEGLSGEVALLLTLDAEGHVTAVAVSRPAGHGFDEAAVAAAREMEFSPAEIDGKPAPIRIEYVIHFQPIVSRNPKTGSEPPAMGSDEQSSSSPTRIVPAPELPASPQPSGLGTGRVVVRGQLRERGTREPIPGGDVAVIRRGAGTDGADLPAELTTTSGDDGRFEVRTDAPGPLRIVVSDPAHESCLRDFTAAELAGPVPVDWNCLVKARDTGPHETRVRAAADHPEETKQTLTRTELTTVPGTANDPLKVLQNLPGVARAPFGLGLLVVRGASPNSTGVFIGGEPVPLLYHFLAGPSVFSAFLIDKIDFYPGGFGVRYGRFAGGAVDVTIASDVGKTLHGAADINVRDSSAFISGPLPGGVRASFGFRRSYIDQLLPLFIKPKVGSTFVTLSPVYYDYQGRLDKDLPGGGRLSLVLFGSSDTFNVIAQDPTRMLTSDTHIGFNHVMGEWLTTFAGWSSRLASTYGYGDQSFSTGTFAGYQRYHRLYSREDLSRRLHRTLALTVGLDVILSYDWANYDIPLPREGRTLGRTIPEQTPITRSLYDAAPAAYVEAQWDPLPTLRLVPGLRFDYYRVFDTNKWSLDPRLAVRWAVTPRLALKASAGVYHELPTPQFLDPEFGNPNLNLPWADQYQVGVERRFTEADDLTATLFYVRRHDLPVASVDHFSSLGQGRSYGLELLLRHQITQHFYGWLAYTLSRTEVAGRLADDIPMGNMGMPRNGADLTWRPGQFDQTHNLVLVASYRWNAKWQTGFTYRLTTGTPRTPIVSSFYDADFNGYTRINGPPNSARNPTFSQLDLRVERTWTFDYWVLGVYLDVQNVLNRENPEGTLYDYRFQESASLRGLPILPILGVRGRF